MRVALVSPYSWTYPGGVTRHIEALATELSAAGHDVRVLDAQGIQQAESREASNRWMEVQKVRAPQYLARSLVPGFGVD